MKKVLCILCILCLFTGCKKQNSEINIYVRDPSSGTREAFEHVIECNDMSKNAIEAFSNQDMANKIGNDVNGIGYVSYVTDLAKNHLKPLSYEGVNVNEITILNNLYPLQRSFSFITRAEGDFESNEKKELILAFIDYMMNSIEAKLCIKANGGIVDMSTAIPWSELAIKYPILNQDNRKYTIITGGSTSVESSLRSLLESFSPLAGNVSFIMNHSGSSDASKRTLGSEKDGANRIDIGFVSRAFKVSDGDISQSMIQGTYCKDAVIIVVNQENTIINDINQSQIQQIFQGNYLKWKDIYD